jgi:bacteriocin biosynthesis cyclodehydratase domain-containing protein
VDTSQTGRSLCQRELVSSAEHDAAPTPELALGPATRMLWRSPGSVHLELGSRAVVVDGLPPEVVRRVASPLPPREPAPPLDDEVSQALAALVEAGYLWQRPRPSADSRPDVPAPRLAGEFAALAVQHGEQAADVLAARRRASVEVHGRGRVAVQLAAVLAAAGVGRVHAAGDGVVRLNQAAPGGISVTDEGETFAVAAAAAIRRAGPDVNPAPLPIDQRADLTVLAMDGPVSDERLSALHSADAPYLALTLGIDSGIVGPLVLPGLTSCVRCADRHRADRDPAWAALAVQLTVARRHGPASAASVCTVLAGVAAQQVLAFLDGEEPACLDGTIELHLPDWRLRRRSWVPHPDCGCTSADGMQV